MRCLCKGAGGRGQQGKGRSRGSMGGGVLTPAPELCRNTCKCQRGQIQHNWSMHGAKLSDCRRGCNANKNRLCHCCHGCHCHCSNVAPGRLKYLPRWRVRTMGAHSFIPSRLSVNHRRQSRRRHGRRHGVEQPQLNPNAARCSMIFKNFLFIFKQNEEGGRGRGRGEDRHANVARQVQGPRSWPQVK